MITLCTLFSFFGGYQQDNSKTTQNPSYLCYPYIRWVLILLVINALSTSLLSRNMFRTVILQYVICIKIKAFTLKITFKALPTQPKNQWSLSGYKGLKLITKLHRYIKYILRPSGPEANYISLQSSGMHRKQNFQIPVHVHVVFGFKSDKAVLTFSFCSSSPLLSLSLPNLFLC